MITPLSKHTGLRLSGMYGPSLSIGLIRARCRPFTPPRQHQTDSRPLQQAWSSDPITAHQALLYGRPHLQLHPPVSPTLPCRQATRPLVAQAENKILFIFLFLFFLLSHHNNRHHSLLWDSGETSSQSITLIEMPFEYVCLT